MNKKNFFFCNGNIALHKRERIRKIEEEYGAEEVTQEKE